MRIGLLSPVWFPVPPTGYGGIEWVVALLADGLVDAGHDVTLFASGDSQTKAELRAVFDVAPSERIGLTLPELYHVARLPRARGGVRRRQRPLGPSWLQRSAVRSHARRAHRARAARRRGRADLRADLARLSRASGSISLSMNQRRPMPGLPWIANCPNALDLSAYPVHPHRGDYLLFLGRLSEDKGAHRAIEVAREAELPLKIAGKMRDPIEKEYFEAHVRPNLGWGIEYLGEVSHEEKVDLLQNARVTLFPIDWEEPFGLVMIESMACGTPVIATRCGAVPEVIEHGRSGLIVDSAGEMAEALSPRRARPDGVPRLRRGALLRRADGRRLRRRVRDGARACNRVDRAEGVATALERIFTVRLERVGKTATMFRVPFDLKQAFGRARPPVRVTIRGHTWRTTPGIYEGVGHVVVNRAVKKATGVDAPDEVEVSMQLDSEPRTVRVPADLQAALAGDPEAKAAFARLSFSHRREYAEWVKQAKRPETRQRRIAATVERVRAGKPQR